MKMKREKNKKTIAGKKEQEGQEVKNDEEEEI